MERKSIAASRHTESFLGALIKSGSVVAVAVLALAFAWLALFGLTKEADNASLCDLVVRELTLNESSLTQLPSELNRLSLDQAAIPPSPSNEESS